MKLHELQPSKGSIKRGKRVGRGEGSGIGGTSQKGHKGAQSRTGYSKKFGFEGGQNPLMRRLPKYGFKNPFRVAYTPLNLETLQVLVDNNPGLTEIDEQVLRKHRLLKGKQLVKVLGRGELKAALTVSAHKFSAAARQAIEAAGGSVVELPVTTGSFGQDEPAAAEAPAAATSAPEADQSAQQATADTPNTDPASDSSTPTE